MHLRISILHALRTLRTREVVVRIYFELSIHPSLQAILAGADFVRTSISRELLGEEAIQALVAA